MYLQSYGLEKNPFRLTADPSMLFLTESHREALGALCYSLLDRKGLVVLVGQAGTGKTSLMTRSIELLPEHVAQCSFLINPTLELNEFLEAVLLGFGIEEIPPSKPRRLALLEKHLLRLHQSDKIGVLLIDEAHKLSGALLEEVRLLGNLESGPDKLLQIVLAGQEDLGAALDRPENVQLKQRVAVRLSLGPLTQSEVGACINFRWKRAGGTTSAPFSAAAIDAVARASGGVPRLMNTICENALVLAFSEGRAMVESGHVAASCADLDLRERSAAPARSMETRTASAASENSPVRLVDSRKRSFWARS